MEKITLTIVVFALAVVIAACSKPATPENTEDTLRRLAAACKEYAEEHPPQEFYPLIDFTPGKLIMGEDPAYDDLIEDGDARYVYLGYVICVPQNADLYALMYKDFVEGRFVPDKNYVRLGTGQTMARLGKAAEVYCTGKPGDAAASAEAMADIPLILERRDAYKDQRAPVAFLDGHIEWLAPGQNELVDQIHQVLPQLDAFGK